MTIEERAKDVVSKLHICLEDGKPKPPSSRIIDALAEQDRIARAEQQEIDIQRAVKYYCKGCSGHCDANCLFRNGLIKAMKGD